MRKTARALVLAVLALLTSVVLGVASAFIAAFALGAATALIVPGTGTPDANIVTDYREHAADRYIAPFEPCTSTNGCNLDGVDYPASFWPLGFIGNWCPGYQCDTWNESVGTGVANLDTDLRYYLDNTSDDITLLGYSQGGAVVSDELRNLGDLTPAELARLSVVMIGNAYNPDGGIFIRLGFLPTIPILNVTFGPPMPTDTGIPITSIGFEYDPVMYAPLYWGNGLTMLNALAAFQLVHGNYLTPNGNGPTDPIAYGYTEEELADILAGPCPGPNCRVDSNGNEYWMIPAKSLPIVDLVMSLVPAPLQPVAKPIADLVSPVLKVLIDLGYDWSGDPGVARWLSILPFSPTTNWATVGVKLAVAAVQGIQAFIGDLGALTTTIAPSSPAPLTTTTVSTLTLKSAPAEEAKTATLATEQVSETETSKPTLTLVKDETATEQETDVVDEKADETQGSGDPSTAVEKDTTSTPDNPPATKPDETTSSGTAAEDKKDDVQKDAADKKDADTDKKPDADKKDADSAKAAA